MEGFIELGKADNLRGAFVRRFTGALVGARVFEGEAVGDELDGLCVGNLVGFTEDWAFGDCGRSCLGGFGRRLFHVCQFARGLQEIIYGRIGADERVDDGDD